jgi:hypothetical protein
MVSYDPSTDTVTLTARGGVKRNSALRLTVLGTSPTGVAKLTGLLLAGNGVQAGTNYVATVTAHGIQQTHAAAGGKKAPRAVVAAEARIVKAAHPAGPLARSRTAAR